MLSSYGSKVVAVPQGRKKREEPRGKSFLLPYFFYSERHTLSRTMKGLRFHPIYKLKVSLPWLHGHWQKSPDSWVRDNRLYYNTESSTSISMFVAVLLAPTSQGGNTEKPTEMSYRRGRLTLVTPNFTKWSVGRLALCSAVNQYLCLQASKQASPLLWRGSISS